MSASGPDTGAIASPTLVFIHGSGDSKHVWDALIEHLPEFQCIALDLPGHGELADRPGPADMSVRDYADSVRAELRRRNMSGVCIIGHSLGSAITLRLAVEYPSLASRLVLVGAGARLRVLPALLDDARSQPAVAKRHLVDLGLAEAHANVARSLEVSAASVANGVLYRDLAACNAFDMMDELARVAQPTLVIVGTEDRLTPPKYATYLRDHLPSAQLATIDNAGHYVAIEQPQHFADAIRAWLTTV